MSGDKYFITKQNAPTGPRFQNEDQLGGQNANHPSYNKYVNAVLTTWGEANPNATPKQAYDFIISLNKKLRKETRSNQNEKIDEIGKRLQSK